MSIAEIHIPIAAQPAPKRRPLSATVRPVASLTQADIRDMFDLYAAYYDATNRSQFERDLVGKHQVVMLHTERQALAGFSTLAISDLTSGGVDAQIIYSGDTIIDRPHWGTQALAFTWIRLTGTIKARAPDRPLYWFLIAKGHRTYRYMSAFAVNFFPNWKTPTPAWARRIIDTLARDRFADAYDPARGVVSFPQSRGHLKPRWTTVDADEADRPDVAFFLRSNPGYVRGDELACLTELAPGNMRPIVRRLFAQGLRE